GQHAWVRSRAEAIAEGWYGPIVTDAAAGRLGDVLLAAKGEVAFFDPDDTGPYVLVGRHGSVTEDEMLVPLLAGVAG
ncbi:MAG TPA: PglZ domain-containing protein, partial [Acidimicrobiales bacterium]|nr:PglZ domain-containing protein [Acidimicrobiales bacterium]